MPLNVTYGLLSLPPIGNEEEKVKPLSFSLSSFFFSLAEEVKPLCVSLSGLLSLPELANEEQQ
jgi:hypothetical protein